MMGMSTTTLLLLVSIPCSCVGGIAAFASVNENGGGRRTTAATALSFAAARRTASPPLSSIGDPNDLDVRSDVEADRRSGPAPIRRDVLARMTAAAAASAATTAFYPPLFAFAADPSAATGAGGHFIENPATLLASSAVISAFTVAVFGGYGGVKEDGEGAEGISLRRALALLARARPKPWTPPPPTVPYGLGAGRVNGPAGAADTEAAAGEKVWFNQPTPYGIQNKNRNPFVEEVEEYCAPGRVTEDCSEAIRGYLADVSDTGAADDAGAIAGYLDTLGDDGAAFAGYVDALSTGKAPPPSSAGAVGAYLDALNGAKGKGADVVPGRRTDPSQLAGRLASVEDRVSSLEAKVDAIPDQVFAKIEAWQVRREEMLSDEVKRIVNLLN